MNDCNWWSCRHFCTKGDNFCIFLFAFLHTQSLLKRVLLYKEIICSFLEQILSLDSRPLLRFLEGDKRNYDRAISPECVYIPLILFIPIFRWHSLHTILPDGLCAFPTDFQNSVWTSTNFDTMTFTTSQLMVTAAKDFTGTDSPPVFFLSWDCFDSSGLTIILR